MLVCYTADLLQFRFLSEIAFPSSLQCTCLLDSSGQQKAFVEDKRGRGEKKVLCYLFLLSVAHSRTCPSSHHMALLLCSSNYCCSFSSQDDRSFMLLLISGFPFKPFSCMKPTLCIKFSHSEMLRMVSAFFPEPSVMYFLVCSPLYYI